tara:strand:- start:335 stop:529 length:195 start_codon:yes stop_codon:yes gene_type:complete
MIEDVGFIFVYVGTFGISDIIVDHYNVKGLWRALYYLFFIAFGLVIIFYFKKQNKKRGEQPLLQ